MISDNKSLLGFNLIWLWDKSDLLHDLLEDMLELPWRPPFVGRAFAFEDAVEVSKPPPPPPPPPLPQPLPPPLLLPPPYATVTAAAAAVTAAAAATCWRYRRHTPPFSPTLPPHA